MNQEFEARAEADYTQPITLVSAYNVPKILVSFTQALWATTTLYRARGDQIDEYGYAAFGLTVAPYAFMSILNIVAHLLTPEYPSIFLVRTPVMEEAEVDGGFLVEKYSSKLTPTVLSSLMMVMMTTADIG